MNITKSALVDNKQNSASKVCTKVGAVAGFGGYIAHAAKVENGIKDLFTTVRLPDESVPGQYIIHKLKGAKQHIIKAASVALVASGVAVCAAAVGAVVGKAIDVVKSKKQQSGNENPQNKTNVVA